MSTAIRRSPVIFQVVPVGQSHQWTSARSGRKSNHRYNRRRQCLKQLGEHLRAVRSGNFLVEGLTPAERRFLDAILTRS